MSAANGAADPNAPNSTLALAIDENPELWSPPDAVEFTVSAPKPSKASKPLRAPATTLRQEKIRHE
jgi:hypothetical protein